MMNPTPLAVKGVVHPAPAAFRQIPFAFRADPVALDDLKLPRTARDVFGLVLDNARHRGWKSRLSNGTLARILGCTTMTVKRALASLEVAGLIRRELTAGGRIRVAIHVIWEGVEQSRSTERASLEHQRSTGGTSAFQGVEQSRSTNQSLSQSERSDGVVSLSNGEEDPASRVPEGPEAAKYLRMCITAAKRGLPQPPPPAVAPQPAATPRQDTAANVVVSMVDQLVRNFTASTQRPRRLTARQLAEETKRRRSRPTPPARP